MSSTLQPFAQFAAIFGGATVGGYLYGRLRRKQLSKPEVGSACRVRCESGTLRCRFLGEERGRWVFSAPIQRDRYVPLRVGERLAFECPHADGVRMFRSEVVARAEEPHRFLVSIPAEVFEAERRADRRNDNVAGSPVLVDNESGELLDVSDGGACVVTLRRHTKGERVRLQAPGLFAERFGWVLETTPAALGRSQGYAARIKFE